MSSIWAYYNEIDPYCVEWLKRLIDDGLIVDGIVDSRSISEVDPEDVKEFTQCHFFAGIGLWSYSLKLAGWPDDRTIWTGSCPCQPFSAAGKGAGTDDDRHLWPDFYHLIRTCRPPVIMGEQVAGKAGYGWLDGVRACMEGEDYACRAVDIPACGKGAPHIRNRLYWVAYPQHPIGWPEYKEHTEAHGRNGSGGSSIIGGLGNSYNSRPQRRREHVGEHPDQQFVGAAGPVSGVAYPIGSRVRDRGRTADAEAAGGAEGARTQRQRFRDDVGDGDDGTGFWDAFDIVHCIDHKARRIEPGTFPLAYGYPQRMARLRALGNAIVPEIAAEVIRAYLDTEE